MTQQTGVGDAGGPAAPSGGLGDRIEHEKQDARAAAREFGDDVKDKAGKLASDAKAAAEEKVEEAQHGIGAGLKSIGGAFRAASDHLSGEHQATASRMAKEAATGIDRLSDTLQNRSIDEVVGELRDFGRRNAGGLFAGSLLAGLALGRLIKLSAKAATSEDDTGSSNFRGAADDRSGSGATGSAQSGQSQGGSNYGGKTSGGPTGSGSTGAGGSGVAGSTGGNTAGSVGSGPVGAPASDPARPAVGREPAAGGVGGSTGGVRPGFAGTERTS
jgi:hypothetical protein